MRKFLEIGGFIAGALLIVFGVVAIAMGVDGRSTVRDSLKAEQIVGSPDMTPSAIREEAMKAGLPSSIALPTTDVAGKAIDTGARARAFATYIRIHALEATGGQVYAQMPRFATADGKGTSDAALALKDEKGQPVANPLRNTWIQATTLSTALNTSYMAEQLALFGIVIGVALLLAGIGFIILAVGGTMRNPYPAFKLSVHRKPKAVAAGAV
jgi:hypothetical protein